MIKDIFLYNYKLGRLVGPYRTRVISSIYQLTHGAWVSHHVKLRINNCIYINLK